MCRMKIGRNREGILYLKGRLTLAFENHLNQQIIEEHLAEVEATKVRDNKPISLDEEKQVDYEPNYSNAYLTEPDDMSFNCNIGDSSFMLDDEPDFKIIGEAFPTSFLASGNFEHIANF
ncbi:uncharacterized protein A4U43_C01F16840 [Asparagus officinalis]|uniref:Uncharacterized protein n=1 Tax=Asparagus officinalis TaxID=4686 RepID=A0A5P1FQI8_ASPOF|nr:uncharacterized protein A4U43_C01F16840 [Asparagus officinalis]